MDKKTETGLALFKNYWSEVFPVETGLRSTAIIESPDEDVEAYKEFLNSVNISYQIVTVTQLNEERKKRGQDPFYNQYEENIFYIGDDMRKVQNLVECDFNNDFFCVGMMLGYPECCIIAFFQRGTESLDIKKLTEKFPYACHIPCSENCMKTAEYCDKVRKDVEKYSGA